MLPALPAQFDEYRATRSSSVHHVAEDVWSIGLPLHLPDSAIVASTLCYILRDTDGIGHLIDPGDGHPANAARLESALGTAGIDRVGSVLLTHLHPDHAGSAMRLRSRYAADIVVGVNELAATEALRNRPALLAEMAGWGVPLSLREEIANAALDEWNVDVCASILLDAGDTFTVPGHTLRVLDTAGHTAGHICFLDEARSIIYTGDHVLPDVWPGFGFAGFGAANSLRVYLASLERVRDFDDFLVAPGHGFVYHGLDERASAIRAHHLKRARTVQELNIDESASVWAVAVGLRWRAGGWDELPPVLQIAALSQVANHRRFIREGYPLEDSPPTL